MFRAAELQMTREQRNRLMTLKGGFLRDTVSALLWGREPVEEFRAALQSDLERGLVDEWVVGAEHMACGEEKGDEGPLYFFDLGTGQVLFLGGQWLYDPHVVPIGPQSENENTWFRSFTLLRAPRTGIVFQLLSNSPQLTEAGLIIPARLIPFLGESALIEANIEALPEVLSRLI